MDNKENYLFDDETLKYIASEVAKKIFDSLNNKELAEKLLKACGVDDGL